MTVRGRPMGKVAKRGGGHFNPPVSRTTDAKDRVCVEVNTESHSLAGFFSASGMTFCDNLSTVTSDPCLSTFGETERVV